MERSKLEKPLADAVERFVECHKMEDYLNSVDPYLDIEDKGWSRNYITRIALKGTITGEMWVVASEPVVASSIPIEDVIEYNLELKDWSLEIANQIAGIFVTTLNQNQCNVEVEIPEPKIVDGMIDFFNDATPPIVTKVVLPNNHSISVLLQLNDDATLGEKSCG